VLRQTVIRFQEEFAKQKAFKVAPSLQSADFVFLMLVEYEYNQVAVGAISVGSGDIKSVAALVVPPGAYTQYKSDLDNLRDKALWQTSENKRFLHAGDLPKKIVSLLTSTLRFYGADRQLIVAAANTAAAAPETHSDCAAEHYEV
jgi:hypothetical protein